MSKTGPAHCPENPVLDSPSASSVSQALAAELMASCNWAFGLAGNANSHFIASLSAAGFPFTSVRHESAAVAAADAFHRAGGGVAIATTTCGAGFTNTISTLAEAKAARIPLVYVVGTHPAQPRPFDLDQSALLDALQVCYLTASPSSVRADARIAVELAQFLREPVVIQLPFDIQEAPLIDDGETPKNIHLLDATTTGAQHASSAGLQRPLMATGGAALDTPTTTVEEIAAVLRASRRPLIVVGRGVVLSGTEKIVDSLAERLGALVMHSAMARHALDSPWELGTVGGFAHSWQVELAQQADVVLVLGASFNVFQTRGGNMFAPSSHIIHIVDEPHPASQHVDKRLFSQLEEVLPVLEQLLVAQSAPGRRWREELATPPQPMPAPPATTCADGRLDPRACLAQLNRIVPSARAVCTDGGHFLGWVPKYLDVPGPHSQVIVGTAIQSIGMGMGSLVGLAAARPDDYCILVAGDGGALMGLADLPAALATLRRGAIVIMNDAAYGAELHQYAGAGLDTSSMEIADYDFAAVGAAFGARGFSVRSQADLQQLEDYYAHLDPSAEEVAVIDFKISRLVVADFIKEILAKR